MDIRIETSGGTDLTFSTKQKSDRVHLELIDGGLQRGYELDKQDLIALLKAVTHKS